MGDPREMAATFEEVFRVGDYGRIPDLIMEYATEDFVQEWPQSGERLMRGAARRLAESYPEMSGTSPTFVNKRMLGGPTSSSSRGRSTTATVFP